MALHGLEEWIDASARSEDRAFRSRREILIAHILKWKMQPRGTKNWWLTINEQRRQIADLRQDNPRLTETYIRTRWPRHLRAAMAKATGETDQPPAVDSLSEQDVFEDTYDERTRG